MTASLLLAALLSIPVEAPADTTVALSRGDRIVMENISGEVFVRVWERDEMEVRGLDRDEPSLQARRAGGRVELTAEGRRSKNRDVEVELRVPVWVALEITGRTLDVDVTGVEGGVSIGNLRGDISVSDIRGDLSIRTQQGEVEIRDVVGRVRVSSQGDDVRMVGIEGTIEVQSTRGDLTLLDVDASSVRAETQDGDIDFSGVIRPDGDYGFFVHDGDVVLALPEGTNARVSASTFDGDFESDFPVRLQRYTGGKKFEFTLGDGSARVEVQVFDGEIQLVRR